MIDTPYVELYLYEDEILIAVETCHINFLSAELAGVDWVEENKETHTYLIKEVI